MARVPSDECPILERFIRFREFIREGMGEGDGERIKEDEGRGTRIEGNNKDDNADDEEDNGVRGEGEGSGG